MDKLDENISIETGDEWQRLSPISILYFTVRSLFLLANNFYYLLPVLAINFSSLKENPFIILSVLSGILLLLTFIGFLQYLVYRFRVQGERVEIKQGIITKSHIDLPFERIQNVKLEQPLYYRFNNFACVELDTAGSAKQEAKIVALKMEAAQAFRKVVIENNQHAALINASEGSTHASTDENGNPITPINEPVTEQTLNTRSMKDLIIHGISNNRVWLFLGALAPFYGAIAEGMDEVFLAIGFDFEAYFSLETQAWWEFGLHVLSLVMLIMLVVVLFSVLGSILMFYGYTLNKADDRYIRRSGLLTKQEVSMKQSRIQIMVQQQDWLDILLKRVNLYFEQNKTGARNASQPGQQLANVLLVPAVTLSESAGLMQEVMPEQDMVRQKFHAISKRLILRNSILFSLPLSVLLGAGLQYKNEWGWAAGVGVFLFFTAMFTLRWWRWGYSFDEDFAYVRKGFLGVNYYCYPIRKVQQIMLKQNALMRPYKLASLKVVLASGAVVIPYIQQDAVRAQINKVLDRLVSDKRSWM